MRRNNYPEYIFFFNEGEKRVYPAYGIYGRHLRAVRFENVVIQTRQKDDRPLVFPENAQDAEVDATTNPGNGPFLGRKNSSNGVDSR